MNLRRIFHRDVAARGDVMAKPMRATGVMHYNVDDELTLYNPETQAVHILNPTAALTWDLCDGTREVAEIAANIAALYGIGPEVVQEDVAELLSRFDQVGLLHKRPGH